MLHAVVHKPRPCIAYNDGNGNQTFLLTPLILQYCPLPHPPYPPNNITFATAGSEVMSVSTTIRMPRTRLTMRSGRSTRSSRSVRKKAMEGAAMDTKLVTTMRPSRISQPLRQ